MTALIAHPARLVHVMFAMAAATLVAALILVAPAGAQSGGCEGGPYPGATATDSDGDGVSDADEVVNGTDECDPNDAPMQVCGDWVVGYDASTADTDGDGFTDAVEDSAGTDKCDSTSVVAGTAATTQPPLLALTGPSQLELLAALGLVLVTVGFGSVAIGRRVES